MRSRKDSGFTLIELMVVVAVVAILAAIALPSFSSQIRKGRRAEAISTMQDAQLLLERWRVDHRDYTGTAGSPGYPALTDTAYYDFDLAAATSTPNNYTITATPLGGQAQDECGTLTIVNTAGTVEKKTSTGSTRCW